MPTTGLGAVSRVVGQPPLVEQLELADPGPGEVRVALGATAICHSDVSFIDGDWAGEVPTVWGHEAAGVITDIGPPGTGDPSNQELSVGDVVVVSLIRSCGGCRQCRRGNLVGCTTVFALDAVSPLRDADGRPVGQGLRTAAFADAVVVHASQVVPVPDGLPAEQAALLGCGVLTGVGSVRRTAGVEAGDAVVVIGAGGVGLGAVQGARLERAEAVVAVDPSADRRARSLQLGADHALDPTVVPPQELPGALLDLLGHLADHVILATGAPEALVGAVDLVAPGGTVTLVGMAPDGSELRIDPADLAGSGRRIVGSKMGSARPAEDIPWLVDRVVAGELDLDPVVGRSFSLDDIDAALESLRRGDGVRPMIRFEGEHT